MDHMEMSQPSAHRVYLQQSTNENELYTGDTCSCEKNTKKKHGTHVLVFQLAHLCSLDGLIMENDGLMTRRP